MDHGEAILQKYQLLAPELTERALRLFAAAEAKVLGFGGIAIVSRAIEISRSRIFRRLRDLDCEEKLEPNRIRRKGGGRKKEVELYPALRENLKQLVSPYTRGDPETPLRWTSKWNKIEHRMFSFITKNWRGKPLIDRATIVSLIGSTKTAKGLKIRCELDTRIYPKGIKISDAQMKKVQIKTHRFHGDWNYTIVPNGKTN